MQKEESKVAGDIQWKDRKHILGMPITFTRYSLKGSRLFLSKGLFNVEENELLLYRVLDFKLNRTLLDRILGVGTITLYTCDKTNNELFLQKIKHPETIRDMLSSMVEAERSRLRISGKEIYGVADSDADADTDGSNIN